MARLGTEHRAQSAQDYRVRRQLSSVHNGSALWGFFVLPHCLFLHLSLLFGLRGESKLHRRVLLQRTKYSSVSPPLPLLVFVISVCTPDKLTAGKASKAYPSPQLSSLATPMGSGSLPYTFTPSHPSPPSMYKYDQTSTALRRRRHPLQAADETVVTIRQGLQEPCAV